MISCSTPVSGEQFVTSTYTPAWEGAVPGMKGYIAKGISGASERFAPMLQKAFALNEELDKFIEPGSLSAYTDFVVMR